ncbi:MAG: mechanosensitive ion channel domain-containing protein [Gemmatimonadota bacterium]
MNLHPLLAPFEDWILANPLLGGIVVAASVLVLGEILHRVVSRYILRIIEKFAEQSSVFWDNAFFEARLPQRMAWGVPLLFWYYGVLLIPGLPAPVATAVRRVLLACLVVVLVLSISAALDGIHRIYAELPRARERPIKGFLQVAKIVAYLAGLILVISAIMARSPLIFLTGLGAMTAVLLLVFRDTILSLVAGVQLTSNDLIRVGDWIEMPQFDADGDVVDIALNSVRVQNWDRTFTVIPTHKFLEHSFRNWRGMQESGGRRIKRAFHLDLNTVRFLKEEEVQAFAEWELLGDYIRGKREEIETFNRSRPSGEGVRVPNWRRLTNIGTLRAYIFEYLKHHPRIHQEMTLLVRQLSPGPEGLPIELYVFTSDTAWSAYEGIQADIFDHILATVPQFDLRIYQKPSGTDVRRALKEVAVG